MKGSARSERRRVAAVIDWLNTPRQPGESDTMSFCGPSATPISLSRDWSSNAPPFGLAKPRSRSIRTAHFTPLVSSSTSRKMTSL